MYLLLNTDTDLDIVPSSEPGFTLTGAGAGADWEAEDEMASAEALAAKMKGGFAK